MITKIAVIGCGYWGKNIVRNFKELGALAMICDTAKDGINKAHEIAPGVTTVQNIDDVLASDVVGVVIATPAVTHYPIAEKALKAGKDVFVEKPLAINYEDGAKLVELADANKKLAELSSIDGLTGVSNRRIFDERFEIEWRRSLRSKTPLSIFILDLDFFKKVNDDYGHQAGDICLKEVGQILRRFARRPGDLVARYGGEEFSVILSNTPSSGAVNMSEGIRKEIESRDFSFEGKEFKMTEASE